MCRFAHGFADLKEAQLRQANEEDRCTVPPQQGPAAALELTRSLGQSEAFHGCSQPSENPPGPRQAAEGEEAHAQSNVPESYEARPMTAEATAMTTPQGNAYQVMAPSVPRCAGVMFMALPEVSKEYMGMLANLLEQAAPDYYED